MMNISIVVPTYCEEKRIGQTVKTIWQFFQKRGKKFEIIVSDDGSQDATRQVVKKLQTALPNLILLEGKHSGKGLTVKAGMEKARGEVVLFTDADLATPIEEFSKFEKGFEQSFDIVIGSRGMKREGAPLSRLMMAWGLNFLARLLLGLNFVDTQCGFKAFRKQALKKILPKLKIYSQDKEISDSRVTAAFDLELLFLANKLGFKICEVSVFWHHQTSKAVRPVTESLLTLWEIAKIRLNDLKGNY